MVKAGKVDSNITNMEADNIAIKLPLTFQSKKRKSNADQQKVLKVDNLVFSQPKKKVKAKKDKRKVSLENITLDFAWQEVLVTYKNPFDMLMPQIEWLAGYIEERQEHAPVVAAQPPAQETVVVTEEVAAIETPIPALAEPQAEAVLSLSPDAIQKSVMPRYYKQRYDYFSLFDQGIQLDQEGWYSVTPELIAEHVALQSLQLLQVAYPDRSPYSFIVLDSFCGVGGNTIQYARHFGHVVSIDNNEERLKMAKHNAKVYEVDSYMSFIVGDYWDMTESFAHATPTAVIDLIYLSPPWGGPNYTWLPVFSPINDIFSGRGGDMVKAALAVTKYVVLYLPRQTNIYEIALILQDYGGASLRFRVEQHWLRGKFKAITVYIYPSTTSTASFVSSF